MKNTIVKTLLPILATLAIVFAFFVGTSKVDAALNDGGFETVNTDFEFWTPEQISAFLQSGKANSKIRDDQIREDIHQQAKLLANIQQPGEPATVSVENQAADLEQQIRANIGVGEKDLRLPAYDQYKYDAPVVKYVHVTGWASGQPTKGTHLKKGDGLIYTPSGGSTVTYSVNFGYGGVSFGVGIGSAAEGSVGVLLVAPSAGYYKVWADKTMKVTSTQWYGHQIAGSWVALSPLHAATMSSSNPVLKKVQ
ncbi:hypothetical protein [Schleiferilactobacillus harbinensis]|uniref:Uncharacterized protein n=1 Tax=Schleiferilactobacillus harbinensis TaxID=304207 RepID=A0A5P8M1N3_9LACO|nr:hypothetical protein [Schleiferilactobacillus harbinensis]QFR22184.1 hypothetical protein D1010_01270 [Schleiferilactobacillus harbinensis]